MGELKVKLKPFRVPEYVIQDMPADPRHDGFKEPPKYHLGQLDDDLLLEMCEDFKNNVLEKAREWRHRNDKGFNSI